MKITRQKLILCIGALAVLFLALILTLWLGVAESGVRHARSQAEESQKVPAAETESDLLHAFDRYVYVEKKEDGSMDTVILYKYGHEYIITDTFVAVGGGTRKRTSRLNDKMISRWESSLDSFHQTEKPDVTGAYRIGTLTFTSASGSAIYTVEPLDISGFGLEDGWTQEGDTYLDLTDRQMMLFDVDYFRTLFGYSDIELAAYLGMLDQQIRAQMTDEPTRIYTTAANTAPDYQLQIDTTGGHYVATVSAEGYVAKITKSDAGEE